MQTEPIFANQHALFDNSWEDYFIFGLMIVLILLVLRLQNSAKDQQEYQANKAWVRAGIYFCACFIISWMLGVFKVITRSPVATSSQTNDGGWVVFVLACLLVELVAYYVIWPRGTLTHGRPLAIRSIVLFGVLWGISEGLLFLSIWAGLEHVFANVIVVAFGSFIIISAFLGIWHNKYWDVHVAPEHNIEAWNIKKVLFAHIPNLAITLTFLALHGNALLFIAFQTIALVGSTYFMRFPPYTYQRAYS